MRLSEKTIELNYCAQVNMLLRRRILWFGLTQRQEAQAGFDAYARLGGRLIALQFKASNFVLRTGARRFYAQHHQLEALRALGRQRPSSIFYIFPGLGNTLELTRNSDIVGQCQLLDAGTIPNSVVAPTTRAGKLRKQGIHYVDVTKGHATIHSSPVRVALTGPEQLLEGGVRSAAQSIVAESEVPPPDDDRSWFEDLLGVATVSMMGGVVLPLAV